MVNIARRTGGYTPAYNIDPVRVMRDLMDWDPFSQMSPLSTFEPRAATFTPSFEVKETKEAYVFTADMPGVREEDIDISLTGNRLTVTGKREAEARDESETYYMYERSYGGFSRTFTLPEGINYDNVEANLKNGVLHLTVPKAAEHKPRKISLGGVVEKVKDVITGERGESVPVSKSKGEQPSKH